MRAALILALALSARALPASSPRLRGPRDDDAALTTADEPITAKGASSLLKFTRAFDGSAITFLRHAMLLGSIPEEVPQVWTVATNPTLIFMIIRDPPGGSSTTTLVRRRRRRRDLRPGRRSGPGADATGPGAPATAARGSSARPTPLGRASPWSGLAARAGTLRGFPRSAPGRAPAETSRLRPRPLLRRRDAFSGASTTRRRVTCAGMAATLGTTSNPTSAAHTTTRVSRRGNSAARASSSGAWTTRRRATCAGSDVSPGTTRTPASAGGSTTRASQRRSSAVRAAAERFPRRRGSSLFRRR